VPNVLVPGLIVQNDVSRMVIMRVVASRVSARVVRSLRRYVQHAPQYARITLEEYCREGG
jgi:hypothetical protein